MQMPKGYEAVKVGGEFIPINLGGHKAIIKKAEETETSTGKPMIVLAIEFDKGDSQPDYFTNLFKEDTREDKKWPNSGMIRIVSEDANGECSRSFKSFITALEASNPNFHIEWGKDFGVQFKGKKLGVVYGEVENLYNDKLTMRHEYRWCCDYAKADTQKIPAAKYINGSSPYGSNNPAGMSTNFIDVPDNGSEEDIPF